MRTHNKLLALIILLASIMLSTLKVNAQCYNNFPAPFRSEFQSYYPTSDFVYNPACSSTGITPIVGVGINSYIYNSSQLPNYMLDILCDPTVSPATNLDVNIACPNCTPADAVGYRIGDSMIIWHNGTLSSVFVGVYAGGSGITNPLPGGANNAFLGNLSGYNNTVLMSSTPAYGFANTYLGYAAGYGQPAISAIGYQPGDSNVYIGVNSGYNNTTGSVNVYVGSQTGYLNTTGDSNVMIGNHAGYNNTSEQNTFVGNYAGYSNAAAHASVFIGNDAGYHNISGSWNTFSGNKCGFGNNSGSVNCFYGKHCGYYNYSGSVNNFYGSHCGYNNYGGDNNCAYGSEAFWSNAYGDSNVVIGNNADYFGTGISTMIPQTNNVFIGDWAVKSFIGGDSNVFVGAKSNINTTGGIINNSGAFGYGAIVTASDKIIIGNDTQNVGIGMSGLDLGVGPTNRLEISKFSLATASPLITVPATSFTPVGAGTPQTGGSGLQFRDLTAGSTQNPYVTNQGFLTVDDLGNVVLMQAPAGGSGGFGDCNMPLNPPPGLANDPAVDLLSNLHNFWFLGNGSSSLDETAVLIGYKCGSIPPAKLSVMQASGATSSICAYFENSDAGTSCHDPVIGIKSYVDNNTGDFPKVAGWFEATRSGNCCVEDYHQYAILVPQNGGDVEIGVDLSHDVPCASDRYLLSVYGSGWAYGSFISSDSVLKTNVTKINTTSNALSVIQKLNGVSFNYNNSVIRDSGMGGTHYGFIAQQVKRVLPNVVKTDNNGIEAVAYTEIIPWTVEALKQEKQTNDSLRYTLDSLRSAFQSMQTCLTTLCGNNRSPVHHTGGNGNSGDSNTTFTNVQDVMLSASVNAPLLYQNIPNPFSTGTKINYYLPEGTLGATMVFYDTYGNQIKVVQLSQTGNGTLNITPDNLSGGIYSYSLVVNNNIIDTKRMILQK